MQLRQQHSTASGLQIGHQVVKMLLEEVASRPVDPQQQTSIQPSRGTSSELVGDSEASSTDVSEASNLTRSKGVGSASSASCAAEIIQNGGLRVLCRTRAQVEAACSVNWL